MTEPTLFKITGEIKGLKAAHVGPERTYYENIWMREANERQTTLQKVSAAQEMAAYLSVGQTVTLYLVRSPSGNKCLFAIDAGANHAESIDPIGRDQAKAFRSAIKWVLGAILLIVPLVVFLLLPFTLEGVIKWLIIAILGSAALVGCVVLPLAIRGMLLLSKAPKPADLRAFLAADRTAG